MKKAFCFDIRSWHYLRQNLSTPDLRFSPSYLSRKKGNLENISQPRPTASASKTFFSVSFFLLRITREKLKSDVDKLCLRRAKNKYRNKLNLHVYQCRDHILINFSRNFNQFAFRLNGLQSALIYGEERCHIDKLNP